MQMTLSSSSLSTHSTLTQAFLTFKTFFNRSLPGWLLIFSLLTPVRLNSCSSDSKTNLPKYTTLHLTPHTLLEILYSSLMNILPSLTKLHLSPTPAFVIFAVSDLTSIRQLLVPLLLLSFTPNLITLCYKLSKSQLSRLQLIQNFLARTVAKDPKSCHRRDQTSQRQRAISSLRGWQSAARLLSHWACTRHTKSTNQCVSEVAQWCASRRLQLNSYKIEVIWFGSKANLVKPKTYDCSLTVGSETVQPCRFRRPWPRCPPMDA